MIDRLLVALQGVLPQRAISDVVGRLARIRGGALTSAAIRLFVHGFGVRLDEAATSDPRGFETFNAFFTRALRDGARPQPDDPRAVAAPADGTLSEQGAIAGDRLLQVKGMDYRLADLLEDDALAAAFVDGSFQTIYLAPRDYHRVHMPLTGRARWLRYLPGSLFSVNARTTRTRPRLFCRNERVAVGFEHAAGSFALVMVGALNVGSIELALPHAGRFRNRPQPAAPAGRTVTLTDQPLLTRGAEFGRFNMGSTVITLAAPGLVAWDPLLGAGSRLRMGQAVGRTTTGRAAS